MFKLSNKWELSVINAITPHTINPINIEKIIIIIIIASIVIKNPFFHNSTCSSLLLLSDLLLFCG